MEWLGTHERLAGVQPGGFGGKIQAFTEVLHPDDRARVGKKLESVMAAREETYTDEYRFVHPDGTGRWMVGTGQFFYDSVGTPLRMTGVVQDITERKRAEHVLVEQKNLLELIVAGRPLEECLSFLCASVARLNPRTRACVLWPTPGGVLFPAPSRRTCCRLSARGSKTRPSMS